MTQRKSQSTIIDHYHQCVSFRSIWGPRKQSPDWFWGKSEARVALMSAERSVRAIALPTIPFRSIEPLSSHYRAIIEPLSSHSRENNERKTMQSYDKKMRKASFIQKNAIKA